MGLEPEASLAEIKKAYRKLAMRYHPDRNAEPRAAQAFILVNEAYEYLSNPVLRSTASKRPRTGRERDEEVRRAHHEDWEAYQKEAARQRAARHAQSSAEQFSRAPIYKAAAVLDSVYNYVFIGIGVLIICGPILGVWQMEEAERAEYNFVILTVPILLGLGFIYGIWYFVFKLKGEEA